MLARAEGWYAQGLLALDLEQPAALPFHRRAMRLAAANHDGSAPGMTALFFVTLTPKAEYLSEEAMNTTLGRSSPAPTKKHYENHHPLRKLGGTRH